MGPLTPTLSPTEVGFTRLRRVKKNRNRQQPISIAGEGEEAATGGPLPKQTFLDLRVTMIDLSNLQPGAKGTAHLVVGVEHTAPSIGSGKVPVLATPVMINVIEAAALAAVEHLLPAGHQSLGIHLDVKHFAATPIGMRVVATAELIAVDGRTLSFRVEARDDMEPIGGGSHQRVVVNVVRFDERIQKKLAGR
jgi:fluoroacetyl-CoA thioesterase